MERLYRKHGAVVLADVGVRVEGPRVSYLDGRQVALLTDCIQIPLFGHHDSGDQVEAGVCRIPPLTS